MMITDTPNRRADHRRRTHGGTTMYAVYWDHCCGLLSLLFGCSGADVFISG